MGFVGKMFGGGGEDVGQDIQRGVDLDVAGQREALDYLKEREALPQQLREGALKRWGGMYGLEGGEGSQQEMIDRAMSSPLYQSMMGGREAGEESILRHAGATGGLRSGNVQESLADYNTNLQNTALLRSYNDQMAGLQGLAGLPSLAPMIAQGMSGIGQTLGQGQIAQAQAGQAGQQQGFGNLLGLGQLGLSAYGSGLFGGGQAYSGSAFSDRRLKKNIKKIGEHKGHIFYSWTWNKIAEKMGMSGRSVGCMADEVFKICPEAVSLRQGYLFLNYQTIGILPA